MEDGILHKDGYYSVETSALPVKYDFSCIVNSTNRVKISFGRFLDILRHGPLRRLLFSMNSGQWKARSAMRPRQWSGSHDTPDRVNNHDNFHDSFFTLFAPSGVIPVQRFERVDPRGAFTAFFCRRWFSEKCSTLCQLRFPVSVRQKSVVADTHKSFR